MKFDTQCVQGAYKPGNGDARVLPLYQSTTFAYDTPEQLADIFDLKDPGYMYTRLGNPTVRTGGESAVRHQRLQRRRQRRRDEQDLRRHV